MLLQDRHSSDAYPITEPSDGIVALRYNASTPTRPFARRNRFDLYPWLPKGRDTYTLIANATESPAAPVKEQQPIALVSCIQHTPHGSGAGAGFLAIRALLQNTTLYLDPLWVLELAAVRTAVQIRQVSRRNCQSFGVYLFSAGNMTTYDCSAVLYDGGCLQVDGRSHSCTASCSTPDSASAEVCTLQICVVYLMNS